MAFLYVNPDGVTRPYSTIGDALADANDYDTIVLDPATYTDRIDMNIALVNIRGNTDTPENDDVVIEYGTNSWALRRSTQLTSSGTIYIEGVTLKRTPTSHYQMVASITNQTSSKYLSVIFNRCRLFNNNTGGHITYGIDTQSSYFDNLTFDHCEFPATAGNSYEYAYTDWAKMNRSEILACIYNGAYGNYGGVGSPTVHNYVTTTTSGYGISYSSDYNITLPTDAVGYFDGYVTEEGSAAQRTVYLYNRDTGELEASTTSNPAGYYYVETTSSGMHHIVCLDDPADPLYNDLIIGSATPTLL